jgi:TolB protein
MIGASEGGSQMQKITLTLVGALVVAAIAAVPSQGTPPGKNGRMVFTAEVGQHTQLFSVRPDGSGLKQLTRFKDSDSSNANWSPDGRRIVFEHGGPGEHAGVYTMNADGSGFRSLTSINRPNYYEGTPAYSPDGKRIVFGREVHHAANRITARDYTEIVVMKSDGTSPRVVVPKLSLGTDDAHHFGHVQFSPDGKRIVFGEQNGDRSAAFVIKVDGTGRKQVTPWKLGVADRVDWSPDGSLILFSSNTGSNPINVYTVHPDGSGLKRITHSIDGNDNASSWSPDGKRILVVRGAGGIVALYTMSADGSDRRQVTHRLVVLGGAWGTHS